MAIRLLSSENITGNITVSGTGTFAGNVTLSGQAAPQLFLDSNTAGTPNYTLIANASSQFIIGRAGVSNDFILNSGNATFAGNVTVGNNGNINIPTASSGNANLNFDGTDFKITSNSSSANLKLETNSTTRLTINSSGNATFAGNVAIQSTIPKLSFTDLQQDDWDIINDNGEFKFLCSTGSGVALQLNTNNNATFAGTITSGALSVGTSGTSRFTDTNAYPLQLNRGLAVDVVGAAGTILGIGTYSTGTTYIDATRIIGVLEADGVNGDLYLQVLNSGTHTTALTLNNDTNATFAGNVLFATDGTYDIGSTSGGRPRNVVVSNSIAINTSTGAAGTLNVASTGTFGGLVQVNTSNEKGTQINSTVADKLISSQINALSSTTGTITGAAALELVGQANASGHGRHAWIGAEGTPNTTFETKLKFKIRGETASGYDWAGSAEAPTIMTLEGSGNVGIGTTSPGTKLHVTDANAVVTIEATTNGQNCSTWYKANGNNQWETGCNIGAGTDYQIYDRLNSASRMVVGHDGDVTIPGNVGIGTTLPNDKLEVSGGNVRIYSTNNANHLIIKNNATATSGLFEERIKFLGWNDNENASIIAKGNAYFGSPVNILAFSVSGSEKMSINHSGDVNISGGGILKGMQVLELLNNGSSDASATSPRFYSPASGTLGISCAGLERMRITSAGLATFKNNIELDSSTPTVSLDGRPYGNSGAVIQLLGWAVNYKNWRITTATAGAGTLNFRVSSSVGGDSGWSTVGTISESTGAYVASSDINRKKDLEDSEIGLKEVMELQPKLYRMKEDDKDSNKHLGFIAQEVKKVLPQAYLEQGEDDDKFIGLTEMPIVAALTKAIQELKAEIEQLKTQIK